jgi:hypothetical protein
MEVSVILPKEILVEIARLLTIEDVRSFSEVCLAWRDVSRGNLLFYFNKNTLPILETV